MSCDLSVTCPNNALLGVFLLHDVLVLGNGLGAFVGLRSDVNGDDLVNGYVTYETGAMLFAAEIADGETDTDLMFLANYAYADNASVTVRYTTEEDELGAGDEDSADIENSSAHSSVQKRTCREKVSNLEANKPCPDLSSHPILVDLHLSSDQRRRRHAGDEEIKNVTSNLESLTVQSEFGFPSVMSSGHKRYLPMSNMMGNDQKQHYNLSYYDSYDNRCSMGDNESKTQQYNFDSNQDLEVSDHPHLYQNTLQALQDHTGPSSNSLFIDRSKRNSVRLVQ